MRKAFCWFILLILLTACSSTNAVPLQTDTFPTLPTQTTAIYPATSTATQTPAPTLTPTPLPPELAGLRIVYPTDGNLYLQVGSNPPVQLTDDESIDRWPKFTDDGEKIIFYRGIVPHDLYAINLDGSQERALVSGSTLSQLGLGYDALSEILSYKFIPGTHQLLFTTLQLDESDLENAEHRNSMNNDDLLLVNVDTGEIRQILEPGQCERFYIAPTGELIAIVREGQIDLIDLDGKMIRRNVLTYLRTQPIELSPYLFWTEDGSELFVAVPVDPEYDMEGPETRTLWRIAVDGSIKTELSFDAPLVSSEYTVSPDGRWILYFYFFYTDQDIGIPAGVYLGNLREGGSQLLPILYPTTYHWNPDSTHFLFGDNQVFLGTIDGQSDLIAEKSRILGWIDSRRFLFYSYEDDQIISIGDIDGMIFDIPYLPFRQMFDITFTFVEPQPNP